MIWFKDVLVKVHGAPCVILIINSKLYGYFLLWIISVGIVLTTFLNHLLVLRLKDEESEVDHVMAKMFKGWSKKPSCESWAYWKHVLKNNKKKMEWPPVCTFKKKKKKKKWCASQDKPSQKDHEIEAWHPYGDDGYMNIWRRRSSLMMDYGGVIRKILSS
jgi:hypothetical protein